MVRDRGAGGLQVAVDLAAPEGPDLHLDAADEKEMVRLDVELRPRIIAVQESLRRLSVLLNESERSRGASV